MKKHIFLTLIILIFCLTAGCTNQMNQETEKKDTQKEDVDNNIEAKKADNEDCMFHYECASGVCDHYKKNSGNCAIKLCKIGDKADNNNFFCDSNQKWQKSKTDGDACEFDYECYQPTCFMIPACDITDIPRTKSLCLENKCAYKISPDECERQGYKKTLSKDEYMIMDDGTCIESMEQRILNTVCIPCGDGKCDREIESKCNCPEDCK